MRFPLRPRSQQIDPVLQQLLLGSAREAEGAVLRTGEAGAACGCCQLLEVGLLGRIGTGVHRCGGVPDCHLIQSRQPGKVCVHEADGLEEAAVLGGGHLWQVCGQHILDAVIMREVVRPAGNGSCILGQRLLQVDLQPIQGCQATVVHLLNGCIVAQQQLLGQQGQHQTINTEDVSVS